MGTLGKSYPVELRGLQRMWDLENSLRFPPVLALCHRMGPKLLSRLVPSVRGQRSAPGNPKGTIPKHSQEENPKTETLSMEHKMRKENAGAGELAQQARALALKA